MPWLAHLGEQGEVNAGPGIGQDNSGHGGGSLRKVRLAPVHVSTVPRSLLRRLSRSILHSDGNNEHQDFHQHGLGHDKTREGGLALWAHLRI
jgi:hypothetical protein